jgi:division protein CdvB (Snf7/Vps24/ESCRT-III family)
MEQMTEILKAMQEKMDSTLKEIRASQEHLKEEMLAKMVAKIDTNQEKMDAWIAEMGAW